MAVRICGAPHASPLIQVFVFQNPSQPSFTSSESLPGCQAAPTSVPSQAPLCPGTFPEPQSLDNDSFTITLPCLSKQGQHGVAERALGWESRALSSNPHMAHAFCHRGKPLHYTTLPLMPRDSRTPFLPCKMGESKLVHPTSLRPISY